MKCSLAQETLTIMSGLTFIYISPYYLSRVNIYFNWDIKLKVSLWTNKNPEDSYPWRKRWPSLKIRILYLSLKLKERPSMNKEAIHWQEKMTVCTSSSFQSSRWSMTSYKINISRRRKKLIAYCTEIRSCRWNCWITMLSIIRNRSRGWGNKSKNIKQRMKTISIGSSWQKTTKKILRPHPKSGRNNSNRRSNSFKKKR